MKRSIAKILAIAALLALCVSSLAGCIVIRVGKEPTDKAEEYDDAAKYNIADANGTSISGNVKRLRVYWTSGSVVLKSSPGKTIGLSEKSASELTERTRMHYYFDGETLYVRYVGSGRFSIGTLKKDLTVDLPADVHFEEIEINTVAASVKADRISADDVTFHTVSGNVDAPDVTADDEISFHTISGRIDCNVKGQADKADIYSVSGNISLTIFPKVKLNVNTTSGDITVCAAGSLREAEMRSVSGALYLFLPGDAGFDAKLRSVSGSVSTDFSTKVDDSHYITGDGAIKIEADSISGSIKINILPVNN